MKIRSLAAHPYAELLSALRTSLNRETAAWPGESLPDTADQQPPASLILHFPSLLAKVLFSLLINTAEGLQDYDRYNGHVFPEGQQQSDFLPC